MAAARRNAGPFIGVHDRSAAKLQLDPKQLKAGVATQGTACVTQHWPCSFSSIKLLNNRFLVPQIVVPSLGLSAAVPSGPHTAYLVLSAVNGTGGQLTVVNGRNTSEGPAGNENAPASSNAARTAFLPASPDSTSLATVSLHLPLQPCRAPTPWLRSNVLQPVLCGKLGGRWPLDPSTDHQEKLAACLFRGCWSRQPERRERPDQRLRQHAAQHLPGQVRSLACSAACAHDASDLSTIAARVLHAISSPLRGCCDACAHHMLTHHMQIIQMCPAAVCKHAAELQVSAHC
jgi:hypothetical protein